MPFSFRLNSYKCITDTLQELVNQSKAAPQSPSVPKKPGPPVLSSDPNMLSNEEAGHHVRDIAYFHSGNTLCLEVLCVSGGIIILGKVIALQTYGLRILDILTGVYKAEGHDITATEPLTVLIFIVLF